MKKRRKKIPMPNNCDTLIIGAGAAGLMAAIQCAQRGQSVTLLEKMDRPGASC